MVNDLTKGNSLKLIVKFSIPIILGNLVQQLYSWADTMMVGKLVGNSALAAVGATGAITFLIIGFLMGIAEGVCLIVARCFGANDITSLKRYVGNLIYVCVSVTIVLTVLALLFNRRMLIMMQTPDDIIDQAEAYLKIIYIGMMATMLYNVSAGIMRALGDSRTPLYFLIVSSIANVVLNYVFIVVIPLGVTGAAIATIFSQFGAGIGSVIFLVRKYDLIKLKKEDLIARKTLIFKLCCMSIPMALQYSITAIGSLFLQTAINSLGSDCVAAFTVGEKVWGFGWSAINCVGIGLAGFCGQNIGAGKLGRVRKGVASCTALVLGVSVVITGVFLVFGNELSKIFLELPTESILQNVKTYYLVQSPFFAVLAMIGVYRNAIMGMGYSLQGMLAGIFELVGRTSISLIFVDIYGFAACCIASPMAWILADLLLIPMYFHIIKSLAKQHPEWLENI